MLLKISTGRTTWEKKWRNTEISWEDLTKKLKKTYRTRETVAEYAKLKKPEQGRIKDVGGFVGGWLENGQRKKNTVLNRTVITLDADYATPTFWEDLTLLNDFKCCVYSTHKHTPDAPRLRLIVPLSRAVSPEEYEAIARLLAKDIGIELFDDTTYQASRLMYWPSTPADGVYVYEEQDGPLLNADGMLARYPDWRDVSFWPQSSRVAEIRVSQAKKQGDPLEKDGLIGAFCRTYDVHQVIATYLNDVYEPCTTPDRYTYVQGSTAAGLVVYEDKWAYSNHGTDPASGKLCNAFDLVRIHKFADMDDNAKADTPTNKLPSYGAMLGLIAKDDGVKKTIVTERFNEADMFEEIEPEENTQKDSKDEWLSELTMNGKGQIEPTINNILSILRNDKNLVNLGKYNTFSTRHEVFGSLPWYKSKGHRNWRDEDDAGLRLYIEKVYEISAVNKTNDALDVFRRENEYHPVRDYLDALEWDGINRIDGVLVDYMGAEDTRYARLIARKFLIGAVARIYRPGCKMDNPIILVGAQGFGKSTFIQKLAKRQDWFIDSLTTYQGKEAMEAVRGKWIVEMAELAGMKKAEVETVKGFITSQNDSFRAAYKRHAEDNLRQCVFIGSTNEMEFLRDPTGNRRFWPIDVGERPHSKSVFKDLDNEVDMIWAEAKEAYLSGESWHADAELTNLAKEAQQAHTESNALATTIAEYLERELPARWDEMDMQERIVFFEGYSDEKPGGYYRDRVCTLEIWQECLGGKAKDLNRQRQVEINNAMREIKGWKQKPVIKFKGGYGTTNGYLRDD